MLNRFSSRQRFRFALLLVGAGCIVSCGMTKQEGQALRQDIDALKRELQVSIDTVDKNQAQLKELMDKATELLKRNSADIGAQVEQLQVRVGALTGRIDETTKATTELRDRLNTVEEKMRTTGVPAAGVSSDAIPEDATQLLQKATSLLNAGQYEESRKLFRAFLARFGEHPSASEAQHLLGDSYFAEQRYAPAIQEYRKVIQKFASSAIFPTTLYQIGRAFYQLKWCSDALSFLEEYVKKFPNHAHIKTAEQLLKTIKANRKERQICSS